MFVCMITPFFKQWFDESNQSCGVTQGGVETPLKIEDQKTCYPPFSSLIVLPLTPG